MFTIAYADGAAWNETYWNNPRFNELLVQGRAGDRREEARRDVCRDAADLHDDGGGIVLVFNNYVERPLEKLAHGDIAAQLGNRRDEDRRPLVVRVSYAWHGGSPNGEPPSRDSRPVRAGRGHRTSRL